MLQVQFQRLPLLNSHLNYFVKLLILAGSLLDDVADLQMLEQKQTLNFERLMHLSCPVLVLILLPWVWFSLRQRQKSFLHKDLP